MHMYAHPSTHVYIRIYARISDFILNSDMSTYRCCTHAQHTESTHTDTARTCICTHRRGWN